MDPRRKKIYIIISVVCLVLAVGILVWSKVSTPTVETAPVVIHKTTAAQASGDYIAGFNAPAVFPATDKFNTEVLNTTAFKNLQPYTPLATPTDIGRPNPFINY